MAGGRYVYCWQVIWQIGDELELEGDIDSCFESELLRKTELALMQTIRTAICKHCLPAVAVGPSSFAHKFEALMHAARLDSFTHEGLSSWATSLVSTTSDYGVEHLLGRAEPSDAHQALSTHHV